MPQLTSSPCSKNYDGSSSPFLNRRAPVGVLGGHGPTQMGGRKGRERAPRDCPNEGAKSCC